MLARVKLIQKQLFEQWAVLETLTPSEYMEFRGVLGAVVRVPVAAIPRDRIPARQQAAPRLEVFGTIAQMHAELARALEPPSLYDEFLRHLARRGYAVPPSALERDLRSRMSRNAALVDVLP